MMQTRLVFVGAMIVALLNLGLGIRTLVANALFNIANLAAVKTLFGEGDDSLVLSLYSLALAETWSPDAKRADPIVLASLRAAGSCTRGEVNDAPMVETAGSLQAWLAWRGRCFWLRGEHGAALEVWNQSKVEPFWGRLIILDQGQGDLNRALDEYDQWLAMNPRSVDAWLGLGKLYERMANWRNAESAYEQAIRIAPESALPHQEMAFYRWRRGWSDARTEEELTKAISLAPKFPPNRLELQWLYTDLAATYVWTGRPILAERAARNAIVHGPAESYAYLFLGESLRAQGNYSEAIDAYKKALQLGGTNGWIEYGLAKSYMQIDELTRAKQVADHLATTSFDETAVRLLLDEIEKRSETR